MQHSSGNENTFNANYIFSPHVAKKPSQKVKHYPVNYSNYKSSLESKKQLSIIKTQHETIKKS